MYEGTNQDLAESIRSMYQAAIGAANTYQSTPQAESAFKRLRRYLANDRRFDAFELDQLATEIDWNGGHPSFDWQNRLRKTDPKTPKGGEVRLQAV